MESKKKHKKHKRDIGRAHASAWALERQLQTNCKGSKQSFSVKDLRKLHKQASKLKETTSKVKQSYKNDVTDNVMKYDVPEESQAGSLQVQTMAIQLLQSERRDRMRQLEEDLHYHEHKVISIKEDMETLKEMIEDTEEPLKDKIQECESDY